MTDPAADLAAEDVEHLAAAVVATVKVVSNGVDRRQARRDDRR